jgi:hypothetical protein
MTTATGNVGNVPDPTAGKQTSQESSLSSWAGPLITSNLGRAEALSKEDYQAYGGPLTAGESALQKQAFSGLANLTVPTAAASTYTPTSFTSDGIASKYMNPFLSAALQPQLEEARRQAEISRLNTMGRLAKAGAYGGGRQAVMEALLDENMQREINKLTGAGYQRAYELATGQFNTEQDRARAAAQQAADYGLRALAAQQAGGQEQRAIEQQGVAADLAEFEKQRDFPMQQVAWLQRLTAGLPLAAQNYGYQGASDISNLFGTTGGLMQLLGLLGLVNPSAKPGEKPADKPANTVTEPPAQITQPIVNPGGSGELPVDTGN